MARKNSNRGRWLALAAVVTCVGIGWWSLRGGASEEQEAGRTARTADVAEARRQSFDITTVATGELEARRQVEIRSRVEQQAVIQEIVPEGTQVKAGDVLVRLNADKIQTQIDEQLLQIETSKSELVAAENGYTIQVNENANNLRNAELKVKLAELSLQQWMEGEVKTKREANRLALSQSKLELDRLADKLVRSQKLHDQGFLSKDELERDELDYIRAQSAWVKAQLDDRVYENYQYPKDEKQKRADLEQANSELVKVRMNAEIDLASKAAQRNNRRTQLTIRENSLAKSRQQLEASTVRAPSDGLVVYATSMNRNRWGGNEGPLQIGRQVYPNELLIVLPDTSEMVASVAVHESLAGSVRPGMPANVKVDAVGGTTFRGEVDSIGVLAESGGWRDPDRREYTVKIRLLPGQELTGLKPSMRTEARLTLGRVDDAITIPVQGVFSDGAVRYAYVRRGSRFERVPVRLGQRSDTLAEIAAGLDEGVTVLLRDPAPSEVLAQAWDRAALERVGYSLDERGNPQAPGGRRGTDNAGESQTRAPSTRPGTANAAGAAASGDAKATTAAAKDGAKDGAKAPANAGAARAEAGKAVAGASETKTAEAPVKDKATKAAADATK